MRLINSACPFRQFCAAAGDTVVEFRKEYIEEMMMMVYHQAPCLLQLIRKLDVPVGCLPYLTYMYMKISYDPEAGKARREGKPSISIGGRHCGLL